MENKSLKDQIIDNLSELSDEQIEELFGAQGVILTLTHECHMNSFQSWFGCC